MDDVHDRPDGPCVVYWRKLCYATLKDDQYSETPWRERERKRLAHLREAFCLAMEMLGQTFCALGFQSGNL